MISRIPPLSFRNGVNLLKGSHETILERQPKNEWRVKTGHGFWDRGKGKTGGVLRSRSPVESGGRESMKFRKKKNETVLCEQEVSVGQFHFLKKNREKMWTHGWGKRGFTDTVFKSRGQEAAVGGVKNGGERSSGTPIRRARR